MTTPAILEEEPAQPDRPTHEPGEAENTLQAWLLRIISALVIPGVLLLFFFTFEFLKDARTNKLLQVLIAIAVGVAGVWLLYWGMDRVVSLLPPRIAAATRPFTFAGPALVLLTFYLVYPAVITFIDSLRGAAAGSEFVGLANYQRIFTSIEYLVGIRNSILWVLVVPISAVIIGLTIATLTDKLPTKSEAVAKSFIFLPMAISFVAATVVWGFVYSFRAEGFGEQIGIMNAIWQALGNDPVRWMSVQPWNNLLLMIILIWLQTGFAMVILSSAIKSVPEELLEAARIDGANEWGVFRRIVIPSIASTIVVVWTTVLITTWKVFDIVFVLTGGRDGTSVVAEKMVTEFFTNRNRGLASALAVVLFIAVIPILVINIKRFREQEATR